MPQFIKVITSDKVFDQRGTLVRIGGEDIANFRRDGKYYAVGNVCAHQHFSMLHQGMLDGLTVTCPMHGWTYNLCDGLSTTGQGRVKTFPVKLIGDDVFVEV